MDNLRDWLSLYLAPGLGSVLWSRLLAVFETPTNVLQAHSRELQKVPGIGAKLASGIDADRLRSAADAELFMASQKDTNILCFDDPRYPPLLREIHDPPRILYVRGDVSVLSSPCLAMVGSRAATVYGKKIAHDFAQKLAGQGLVVVSGVALGIDGASHLGAVASGRTIGVLGCGVDVVYPKSHRGLYGAIVENGALVSEYPFGVRPEPFRFPARNRIISGLSLGVIVVEAASKSGSLITAELALDQGRDVFAIPGRVDSPKSHGAHRLLQEGAMLAQSVDDIIRELGFGDRGPGMSQESKKIYTTDLTSEEETLYGLLDVYPQTIDDLIVSSGLRPDKMAELLLLLELKGVVEVLPGNQYKTA
ncbi:MAG: DNA-processing protein DprA [Spirochaetales bacterium]|jgi:DNA processing protein|nr:DNA-processing protein DprA [Spirochaetales bacterium]